MTRKKSFYITTTIPYVNADPHIGFALELVQSDTIARYQRLRGRDVFFSTGTDEHGQKIWEGSVREDKPVQDYVDHYAQKFLDLKVALNLSYDNFIRTTSPGHIKAAEYFWRLCDTKGDIYKKIYRGLYCVGCEKFITEKDLMNGACSLHPNQKPEMVEEENYFFRLSNYKKKLLEYLSNEESIIPEWRRKEAIDFVQDGMEDFSISRDKKRSSWGIAIPGDDNQVMYVWFDALVNYISSLGWPNSKGAFEKFWVDGGTVQTAGKDMVKFQSVMWQGMLMSAGLPTTDTIVYHGFITGEGGIKMSKSTGNVIGPDEIVQEYGTDALRYFLLREISPFEDSPFTMERFKEAYNANLANGLGNLVSRIMKMATLNNISVEKLPTYEEAFESDSKDGNARFSVAMSKFDIKHATDLLWFRMSLIDATIQLEQPFKLLKSDKSQDKANGVKYIQQALVGLYQIALLLESIIPSTAIEIQRLVSENRMPDQPLFPRKD